MEKQKKWQLYLIVTVIILTIYNILPTIFYYSKPLKTPIDQNRANEISKQIIERVNDLEPQAEEWLASFCRLIKVSPLSIATKQDQPQFAVVNFKNVEDANRFRHYLPRSGALIPFVPAQLSLYDPNETASKSVLVQRRIPIHFDETQPNNYFEFSSKFNSQGTPTPLYRALVEDRALQIGMSLGGPTENAQYVHGITTSSNPAQTQELLAYLAQNIVSFTKVYGETSEISKSYFASFTQISGINRTRTIQDLIRAFDTFKDQLTTEKNTLIEEAERLKAQGNYLETLKQQRLESLISKEKTLIQAIAVVKRNATAFSSGQEPWNYASLHAALQEGSVSNEMMQIVSFNGKNPYLDQMIIDWNNEKILLNIKPEVLQFKQAASLGKNASYLMDQVDQLLYNEIALASRQSGEEIVPFQNNFEVELNELQDSKSFLAMRLSSIAKLQAAQLKDTLVKTWQPTHPDLSRENFPIYDYDTYINLPLEQQKLALVVYAPSLYRKIPPQGFHMNSIYVIAKGMDKILHRLQNEPQSAQTQQFIQDFNSLRSILQHNHFMGYSGSSYALSSEYAHDFIFEGEDYYQTVLNASRENFTIHGTKRFAILEFTDVEQRILTENKIDNQRHEDLLKWRDDYRAAQHNIKGIHKFDVPKPTQNVFWDNFKLSFVKYFRGDDRKILHWGLDLSGGKSVQIELRDSNQRPVTNPADINQGINELYNRVNKMGVSEVSIRQEGNFITLDFPGSQGLSAAELVKASTMYFHIVNEKFGQNNALLASTVNQFLTEIWNEAVVTNRKDAEEINLIAWRHLHGDSTDPEIIQPRSEAARILYENGLRLINPQDNTVTSALNERLSKIGVYRGNDFTDWYGQTHPLVIVFNNFALEGSNLENIQASYDPSKGNYLAFGIRSSYTAKDGQRVQPREDLFAWTSQFAKEKIAGTPVEAFSNGRGWRMSVMLNGSIISAPTLDSALKESAMITGSFTQREINQLEADLKAGSLSFTPHILSEKNVSPELGSQERSHGIIAMAISLILVVGAMIAYYRFGGVVASIAVIFNLLIMWATLQNLQATMTLAGIAGIILTLGMAVDANVLVFERIREEFASSGRIAAAVHAGYRKAFSAILDSNVTTIIAAMILLHFDSGPIKAFAITFIIGIVSSMFTALFMTRFFFAGWVQNPAHKSLNMLNWFRGNKFDFLKYTKKTVVCSAVVILVGLFALIQQRHTIMGMDFSGGYALSVELEQQSGVNYRQAVEKALINAGASSQDFQVRELTPSNQVRLFLSRSLSQNGHPFFGMPLEIDTHDIGYPYESNPKIVWVVESLSKAGINLNPHSLQNLDRTWTDVSGQMSSTMRNSALIGLSVALLCILIYITFRFEFKYAISATLCLIHDVIFTIGAIALLHALGVSIQIDLNTVAALMTMVGYSLNDTIIVFDRIREDLKSMRKTSFRDVLNHSLNITLSRTMMTSLTTLLVLIPLIAMGGSTLFGFALVMAIGVIFGTLSSLFIAAPLMKYFHDRELKKEDSVILNGHSS